MRDETCRNGGPRPRAAQSPGHARRARPPAPVAVEARASVYRTFFTSATVTMVAICLGVQDSRLVLALERSAIDEAPLEQRPDHCGRHSTSRAFDPPLTRGFESSRFARGYKSIYLMFFVDGLVMHRWDSNEQMGCPGAMSKARRRLVLTTVAVMAAFSAPPPTAAEPIAVDRVARVTPAQFAGYVRAGVPVVVTDGFEGWPLSDWDCGTISRDFAGHRMRMEYGDHADGHIAI